MKEQLIKDGWTFDELYYVDIAEEESIDATKLESSGQTRKAPIAWDNAKLAVNALIAENVRPAGFKPKRTVDRKVVLAPLYNWLMEELEFDNIYKMNCFILNNQDKFASIIQDVALKYKAHKAQEREKKNNLQKYQWKLSSAKYNEITHELVSTNTNVYSKYYARKDRSMPEKEFEAYIDINDNVDWWHKNGDSGIDNFSISYVFNSKDHLFYPDFIIKHKDGTIGLYDTKSGNTANAKDINEKAKALFDYCQEHKHKGGIVIKSGTIWKVNDGQNYSYDPKNLGPNWKDY